MGRDLEQFVKGIEEFFSPKHFEIKSNRKIYNDDGVPLAEFDVEVTGNFGSTEINWLIECRDRPSDGPAPGAWIEQLAGRRQRFGYNKVTAVSTTGFSPSAVDAAAKTEIELRKIDEISVDSVQEWIGNEITTIVAVYNKIIKAGALISNDISSELAQAVKAKIEGSDVDEKIFKLENSEQLLSPKDFWIQYMADHPFPPGGIKANSEGNKQTITVKSRGNNSLGVSTDLGTVAVEEIIIAGEVYLGMADIPVGNLTQYTTESGTLISESIFETVSFPFKGAEESIDIEIHGLAGENVKRLVFKSKPEGQDRLIVSKRILDS